MKRCVPPRRATGPRQPAPSNRLTVLDVCNPKQHAIVGSIFAGAVMIGCQPPAATTTPDLVTLTGTALAGPTCPVERDPPDPDCAERPVAGAGIAVLDGSGSEVALLTTAEDGTFRASLPAGSYRLVPQTVEGLMGTADAVEVDLEAGTEPDPVVLAYDTGIR